MFNNYYILMFTKNKSSSDTDANDLASKMQNMAEHSSFNKNDQQMR